MGVGCFVWLAAPFFGVVGWDIIFRIWLMVFAIGFFAESLILAQDERWRRA